MKIEKEKTDADLEEKPSIDNEKNYDYIKSFEKGNLIADKWLVVNQLETYRNVVSYLVTDVKGENAFTLWLENSEDSSELVNVMDVLSKLKNDNNQRCSLTIVDVGNVEDIFVFLVTIRRNGPTLLQLINFMKNVKVENSTGFEEGFTQPTAAYIAKDILQTMEVLAMSGYVLTSFRTDHWSFDPVSRMFYLSNPMDVSRLFDVRFTSIVQKLDQIKVPWKGCDTFAPSRFHFFVGNFKMTEEDQLEVASFILYFLFNGKLPWSEKMKTREILKIKREFVHKPNIYTSATLAVLLKPYSTQLERAQKILQKVSPKAILKNVYTVPKTMETFPTTIDYDVIYSSLIGFILISVEKSRNSRNLKLDWETEMNQKEMKIASLVLAKRELDELNYTNRKLEYERLFAFEMKMQEEFEKSLGLERVKSFLNDPEEVLHVPKNVKSKKGEQKSKETSSIPQKRARSSDENDHTPTCKVKKKKVKSPKKRGKKLTNVTSPTSDESPAKKKKKVKT